MTIDLRDDVPQVLRFPRDVAPLLRTTERRLARLHRRGLFPVRVIRAGSLRWVKRDELVAWIDRGADGE